MGGLSLWHWLVVGIVVLLLFGKGRFSDMMGDVAKGLKSFKKGISEDDEAQQQPQPAPPPRRLEATPPADPAPAPPPAPAVDSADRAAERREP